MISVMIPTFNDEDTLELCLRSFEDLAEEIPIEMCLVDDCSGDSTLDIIQRLSKELQYSIVWTQNDRRQGWTENRQRLLGMATGNILLSTDSDCVLREDCIGDLQAIAKELLPKWGVALPTIALVGDVFHTNDRVVEGPDPNHSLWYRGGRERWFTNLVMSEEYLADVAFCDRYPGEPPLFHLKSVRSDLRIVQRHYTRPWLAETGGEKPFILWLMREAEITDDEFPAWVEKQALHLCLSEGLQRYNPEEWYPYPAVMAEELANPRYRLIYQDGEIVERRRA